MSVISDTSKTAQTNLEQILGPLAENEDIVLLMAVFLSDNGGNDIHGNVEEAKEIAIDWLKSE